MKIHANFAKMIDRPVLPYAYFIVLSNVPTYVTAIYLTRQNATIHFKFRKKCIKIASYNSMSFFSKFFFTFRIKNKVRLHIGTTSPNFTFFSDFSPVFNVCLDLLGRTKPKYKHGSIVCA